MRLQTRPKQAWHGSLSLMVVFYVERKFEVWIPYTVATLNTEDSPQTHLKNVNMVFSWAIKRHPSLTGIQQDRQNHHHNHNNNCQLEIHRNIIAVPQICNPKPNGCSGFGSHCCYVVNVDDGPVNHTSPIHGTCQSNQHIVRGWTQALRAKCIGPTHSILFFSTLMLERHICVISSKDNYI